MLEQPSNVCCTNVQMEGGPDSVAAKIGSYGYQKTAQEHQIAAADKPVVLADCVRGPGNSVQLKHYHVVAAAAQQLHSCNKLGLTADPDVGDVAFILLPASADGLTILITPKLSFFRHNADDKKKRYFFKSHLLQRAKSNSSSKANIPADTMVAADKILVPVNIKFGPCSLSVDFLHKSPGPARV